MTRTGDSSQGSRKPARPKAAAFSLRVVSGLISERIFGSCYSPQEFLTQEAFIKELGLEVKVEGKRLTNYTVDGFANFDGSSG